MSQKHDVLELVELTEFGPEKIADMVGCDETFVRNIRAEHGSEAGNLTVLERNEAWWKYNKPGQKPTQKELAKDFKVSQGRISNVVQLSRDTILRSMHMLPAGVPPKPVAKLKTDHRAYAIAFADGFKWRPWVRHLNQLSDGELFGMYKAAHSMMPGFYDQRRDLEKWKEKKSVLRSIARRHCVGVQAFELFCQHRHVAFKEEFTAKLHDEVGHNKTRQAAREPNPDGDTRAVNFDDCVDYWPDAERLENKLTA